MCCRSTQGSPKNPAAAAGYWGDYRNCDTPWNVFEDTLQQVKKIHQVKIILCSTRFSEIGYQRWEDRVPSVRVT
jgi:hypothetical protein